VLEKTIEYIRQLIMERQRLVAQVQSQGGEVPDDLLRW
jgi:hypothetical protein